MKGAALVFINGPRKGEVLPLSRVGRQTLGRSDHSELQVLEEGLSRTHCSMEYRDGKYLLTDLNSSKEPTSTTAR